MSWICASLFKVNKFYNWKLSTLITFFFINKCSFRLSEKLIFLCQNGKEKLLLDNCIRQENYRKFRSNHKRGREQVFPFHFTSCAKVSIEKFFHFTNSFVVFISLTFIFSQVQNSFVMDKINRKSLVKQFTGFKSLIPISTPTTWLSLIRWCIKKNMFDVSAQNTPPQYLTEIQLLHEENLKFKKHFTWVKFDFNRPNFNFVSQPWCSFSLSLTLSHRTN